MSRNIVVVEALSTGFNFLEDIHAKGYDPVVVECYMPNEGVRKMLGDERRANYAKIKFPFKIIKEDPDYEKILREVKAVEPLLVLPGHEIGVILATRLADDLGLPGTPYSNIALMTEKSAAQRRLKESGLRHIRGREVKTLEECISFSEDVGTEDLVIKHVHGAASVGVHLVHGREELADAFRKEINEREFFGEEETRLMVQERIFGEEYIVNTLSRDGVPALASVLKYTKTRTPSGAIIYRAAESVGELGEKEKALVEYAFATVRALGIIDGAVHGEYMVDDKGPVLIEANCRVMGANVPPDFSDKIFGHHETDVALDCMLDKDFHKKFMQRRYKTLHKGYIKLFSSERDKRIVFSGILPLLTRMKSYHSGHVANAGMSDFVAETVDLMTATGKIFLVSDDDAVTEREYKFLTDIEDNYPELLHSEGSLFRAPADESKITPEMEKVFRSDTETLIFDILSYFQNGEKGEPPVPESVLDADPYNREIMEFFKRSL